MSLAEYLDDDRAWLVRLADFAGVPWKTARASLKEDLRTLLRRCCDELDIDWGRDWKQEWSDAGCLRLWRACRFHWQAAGERSSRQQVVSQSATHFPPKKDVARQQLSPPRADITWQAVVDALWNSQRPGVPISRLGGNPLLDCVLVEAVIRGVPRCVERFQELFHSEFHKEQASWPDVRRFADRHDELLVNLCQFDRPSTERRRLGTYYGRAALRVWLRQVIHHDLLGLLRRESRHSESQLASGEDLSIREGVPTILEQLIRRFAGVALQRLDGTQRQSLAWKYVDRQSNRDIARRLRVSEGQCSRIVARALRDFAHQFQDLAGLDTVDSESAEVLDRHSASLANLLVEAISQASEHLEE